MMSHAARYSSPGYSRSSGRLRIETRLASRLAGGRKRYSRSSGRLRIETFRNDPVLICKGGYSRSSGRLRIETKCAMIARRSGRVVTAALRGG